MFEGLIPNANYRFYYVLANDFPLAPIYGETVIQMDVKTLPFKSMVAFRITVSAILLLLAIVFWDEKFPQVLFSCWLYILD